MIKTNSTTSWQLRDVLFNRLMGTSLATFFSNLKMKTLALFLSPGSNIRTYFLPFLKQSFIVSWASSRADDPSGRTITKSLGCIYPLSYRWLLPISSAQHPTADSKISKWISSRMMSQERHPLSCASCIHEVDVFFTRLTLTYANFSLALL
jgi:hypothetical protein